VEQFQMSIPFKKRISAVELRKLSGGGRSDDPEALLGSVSEVCLSRDADRIDDRMASGVDIDRRVGRDVISPQQVGQAGFRRKRGLARIAVRAGGAGRVLVVGIAAVVDEIGVTCL